MIAFAEIRAQAWKYGAIALAVLAVAACIAVVVFRSSAAVAGLRATAATHEAQQAVAEAQGLRAALVEEHTKATALNALADQYEKDKAHAIEVRDGVIAGLRAGIVRLRDEWTCPANLPGVAADPGQLDAAEQRRIQGASDLVRLAAEWDAKEHALQAVAEADRK